MHDEKCITYTVNQRENFLYFGRDILTKIPKMLAYHLSPSKIFIICDNAVAPLYGIKLERELSKAGIDCQLLSIPSGESAKSWERAWSLCDYLLKKTIDRKTSLIAIGGGAIGDLVGFVASIILRGIDWVFVPTTMLAQADSAIGGKTGLNTRFGKNLIGSFHFPKLVINDANTLQSLPLSQIKSGYVEVFKHALLMSCTNDILKLDKQAFLDPEILWRLVQVSAKQKIDLINDDWFDVKFNGRTRLNFGHTFGHGYETLSNYHISHGQAIAMGICTAIDFAVWSYLCDFSYAKMVKDHFDAMGIDWRYDNFFVSKQQTMNFIDVIQRDKKQEKGKISLVLPDHKNKIKLTTGFTTDQILSFIKHTCTRSMIA